MSFFELEYHLGGFPPLLGNRSESVSNVFEIEIEGVKRGCYISELARVILQKCQP
jgi:hypothetical protein